MAIMDKQINITIEQNITIVRAINSLFINFERMVLKNIIFREGVLPQATPISG